ncbi:HPr family phosphocarrier protein [Mediterraneibacter sp. NSJ-55]|uniref:HPr family phosphocarrier protein n=1 Tax=Mediterraneibacter hominis TaxID=2763054 RepID=A0A923RP63_9FIRM|nr:HPr family phosphocarrier protein [Mediterraneibacter hominis]MBC5688081.1 HPr family phosphocarrier protein [Mediterraneibacter hominis]
MVSVKLQFKTAKNAALFIATCQDYNCDIDLICGRYTVDAKSTLGVMSISPDHICTAIIHTCDKKVIARFINDMKLWKIEGD